jgi:hypothetical protein
MDSIRPERNIRGYYERWSASVFTFCRLYIGDQGSAEAATARVFSAFFKLGLPLYQDRLPIALFRCMLASVQHLPVAIPDPAQRSEFCHVVLALPADERAILILHGTLGMHFRCLAAVAGVSRQRVQQLWLRGLTRVRLYFPDFHPRKYRQARDTELPWVFAPTG